MRRSQGGVAFRGTPLLDERPQVPETASIYAKGPDEQWSVP